MKERILIGFVLACLLFGCKKDSKLNTNYSMHGSANSLRGYAQKGPFGVGSSITVFELDASYYQTGRSFFSQINDNTGSFQLGNIRLISNNVIIRADGFYYNEICGANSVSQISLNCISDISNAASLNVNLMTHLEKPRVEYLLTTGVSFSDAKAQAQAEVMNIFSMTLNGMPPSENLNIAQAGDTNAVLLAISSVLQGFRKEGELSAMLATIASDIRTDGVLNDSAIRSSLLDQAVLLDTVAIRNNLSTFYSSAGIIFTIPNFEKYIHQFIINTSYTKTNSEITYLQNGFYGPNLLNKSQLNYGANQYVSFAGQSKKCCNMKFRMHRLSGGYWSLAQGIALNMTITTYNQTTDEQYFTIVNPEFSFDCDMYIAPGTYLIEYFENNMNTPTFSKIITAN